MSAALIGKPGPYKRPQDNPWWRGGKRRLQDRTANATRDEINAWRLAVYRNGQYKCKHCGKLGKNTRGCEGIGLDTAHIKPWLLFPKLRLDIKNGIVLCRKCHIAFDVANGSRSAVRVASM
jgi:predicted restriction endonuclease